MDLRLTPIKSGLIAAVIATAVYSPALFNGFEWDDSYLIMDNKSIRSFLNIPKFFVQPWSTGTSYATGARQNQSYWRPLAETSFTIDYALGHGASWVFHLDSLLWHAAMIVLLALLFGRLGLSPPMILAGALFFGLQPVHTEAVDVICYRTTIMAGLFGIWATYVHLRPGKYGLRQGIVSAVLLLLALTAKETAGAFVLIIPALDLAMHRLSKRIILRAYLPGMAVVTIYVAAHIWVTGPGLYSFFAGMSLTTRLLTGFKIFYKYIHLVFFPWPLTPFYDWWILGIPRSIADPEVFAGIILLILYIVALIISARKNREIFIGLLIFILGLFPVSHIVPFFDAMAERFMYIPMAGASLAIVVAMDRAGTRLNMKRIFVWMAALIFLIFGGLTTLRTTQWHSTEKILAKEVANFPESTGARLGLTELYVRTKRYKDAIATIRPVTIRAPKMQIGWAWLVAATGLSGDYIGAKRLLHKVPPANSGEQTAVMLARSILLSIHRAEVARKIGI